MTLALILAVQAAAVPALSPIGRQDLPPRGCAAYLWVAGDGGKQGVVAMASGDPASLRLSLDGAAPVDLPRVAQRGTMALGLAETGDYRAGAIAATLTLSIVTRADLRDGAAVPQATLSVVRDGGDALVVPLAGLIGCRAGS